MGVPGQFVSVCGLFGGCSRAVRERLRMVSWCFTRPGRNHRRAHPRHWARRHLGVLPQGAGETATACSGCSVRTVLCTDRPRAVCSPCPSHNSLVLVWCCDRRLLMPIATAFAYSTSNGCQPFPEFPDYRTDIGRGRADRRRPSPLPGRMSTENRSVSTVMSDRVARDSYVICQCQRHRNMELASLPTSPVRTAVPATPTER